MKLPRLFFTAVFALCASALSAADTTTLTLADFTDEKGAKPGPGWVVEEGGVIHRQAKEGAACLLVAFGDLSPII